MVILNFLVGWAMQFKPQNENSEKMLRHFREMLHELKAEAAVMRFDGSNDSGWTHLYGIRRGSTTWTISDKDDKEKKTLKMPTITATFETVQWREEGWYIKSALSVRTLEEVVGHIFTDLTTHIRGWEDGMGAHGEMIIGFGEASLEYTQKGSYQSVDFYSKRKRRKNKTTTITTAQLPGFSGMEVLTMTLREAQ